MIETLLAQNEGKTIEFKETAKSLHGILKTVVAFANTAGGTIVIGIRDGSKEILGLEDVLKEEERLANAMADNIAPLLMPDIEIQSFRDKELLVIRVPHNAGPYYLKSEGSESGVYIRFGSTNRRVDAETLASLKLLAQNKAYDELPHLSAKLSANILKEVFAWIHKSPTQTVLENLGVLTRYRNKLCPTHGGILLFCRKRLQFFPDSIIRCARFIGVTKEEILDHAEIEVPLPLAIDQTITFIERNTRKSVKIGRMQREDILEYPPFAIREAVTNAILHTDYAMTGCHIQIAIFDDRIEFTNPGGLPFGLTLEKALSGTSRLRNRVIGRIFQKLRLTEQWGSGLQRILGTCKGKGLKTPLVEELNNQFRLTLFSTQTKEIEIASWGKILLKFLKEEGSITTKIAAKVWKVSTRTARLRLQRLEEEGFVVRLATSPSDPNVIYVPARQ